MAEQVPESPATGRGASDAEPGDSAVPYADRLTNASKWAVGALATVATTAVTKLGLDRLGNGDIDGALVVWAYAGLGFFALGVTSLVVSVVWHTHANRVTLAYLLICRGNHPSIRDSVRS